jgi:hypothetical protein
LQKECLVTKDSDTDDTNSSENRIDKTYTVINDSIINGSNDTPPPLDVSSFNHAAVCLFPANKHGTLFVHANIHSLMSKIDEVRQHVLTSNIKILSINESLLDSTISDSEVSLDGFSLFRCDRNRNGGGVALYICDRLNPTHLHSFPLCDHVEAISVSITIGNTPFTVVSIYRQPTNLTLSFSKLYEINESSLAPCKNTIILGDLNINYDNAPSNRAREIETTFQLTQLIKVPTRVTDSTSTIIDHIYTTLPHRHSESGNIPLTISDHYWTYTILNLRAPKANSSTIINSRSYKYFDIHKFQRDISMSEVFTNIYSITDVNDAWDAWFAEFDRISNLHAPKRKIKIKSRNNPWFTKDLIASIHHRDYLHKKATTSKYHSDMVSYRQKRNKVNSDIFKAKRKYYHEAITRSGNSRDMWAKLRSILPTKTTSTKLTSGITPNQFNDFCSTIGEKLTNKSNVSEPRAINTSDYEWSGHSPNTDQGISSFAFHQISVDFTHRKLNNLKPSKSHDVLGFENKLLCDSALFIAPSLTHIYNLSLYHGIFPENFKLARVTPVHKGKGDRSDPSNYRPISVISTVAKILESAVKEQLMGHIENNNLLSSQHFAYIKGRSTQIALQCITERWLKAIDNGNVTAACFIDLSKCFDTVNHENLL